MKIKVEIHRDEKGRPSILKIKRGRKKLRAEVMETDQDGYTSKVFLTGSRDAMPNFGDVLSRFFDGHLARIGTIDELSVLAILERIDLIKQIEVIESMPDPTPKGSEGVAFKQKSASAGSWQSPDGASDPDSKWSNEANAYDDNTATYSQHANLGTYEWGSWLHLTFSTAIKANKLRFWIDNSNATGGVDINARIGGVDTDIFQGDLGDGEFIEKEFGEGSVDRISIRFYNKDGVPFIQPRVHETDLWQVPSTGGEMTEENSASIKTAVEAIQTAVEIIDNFISGSEGQVDVVTQPSTLFLHDRKTYKTAVFDASASGNLVAAVAAKKIKLHGLTIQAQGTVTVNLNDGSGGSSLMEWKFEDREGAVVPFASAPAYWAIASTNTALYVTLSAAVTVTITAIYSDDDAS